MNGIPCPDWLPDWRDLNGYPDPKSTTKTQWAWEFLRRNSHYQSEWSQVQNDPSFGSCYPPEVDPRREDIELNLYWKMLYLGGKWGLSCPAPDPCLESPEVLVFQSSSLVGLADFEHAQLFEGISLVPSRWENVTVMFDLSLPLEPQLKETKKVLTNIKSRLAEDSKIELNKPLSRTPKGELLLNYLRCADARSCGASTKEVAAIVFADVKNEYPDFNAEQRVRDSLKAADELIMTKYRFLDNDTAKN